MDVEEEKVMAVDRGGRGWADSLYCLRAGLVVLFPEGGAEWYSSQWRSVRICTEFLVSCCVCIYSYSMLGIVCETANDRKRALRGEGEGEGEGGRDTEEGKKKWSRGAVVVSSGKGPGGAMASRRNQRCLC